MRITKIVVLAEIDNSDVHKVLISKEQELHVISVCTNLKGGLTLDEYKLPFTFERKMIDKAV